MILRQRVRGSVRLRREAASRTPPRRDQTILTCDMYKTYKQILIENCNRGAERGRHAPGQAAGKLVSSWGPHIGQYKIIYY